LINDYRFYDGFSSPANLADSPFDPLQGPPYSNQLNPTGQLHPKYGTNPNTLYYGNTSYGGYDFNQPYIALPAGNYEVTCTLG